MQTFQQRTRGSVWDKSLLEEVPARFRSLYTIVLPVKYFIFFLFGVFGVIYQNAPTLAKVTSESYVDIWTLVVGAAALVCLLGLAARRAQAELYATIILVVTLASYPLSLIWVGIGGDLEKLDLGIGLFVFLVLPTWRIFDIVRTERHRHGTR
jgi:hypothetical protein